MDEKMTCPQKNRHIPLLVGEELLVELEEAEEDPPVPDPPAVVDNWANPIDSGELRSTIYTFFYIYIKLRYEATI